MELNPTERRSLVTVACLLALGTAVRLGLGPGAAEFAWRPVDDGVARTSPGAVGAEVREAIVRAERAATPLAPEERIELNAAPAEELNRLPGIGAVRARAIVEDRERRGPFSSVRELVRVSGIGAATVERLAPHLRVEAPPGGFPPVPRGALDIRPGARDDGPGRPAGSPSGGGFDLNRANVNELQEITGIGPVLAHRIVAERMRRGRFRRIEELLEVPGIGPRRLDELRPWLRIVP